MHSFAAAHTGFRSKSDMRRDYSEDTRNSGREVRAGRNWHAFCKYLYGKSLHFVPCGNVRVVVGFSARQESSSMKNTTSFLLAALAALTVAAPAHAQGASAIDVRTELRNMVTQPNAAEQNRDAIRSFLERSDVSSAAEAHGLDIELLSDGVGTLGAEAAANLATRVEQTIDQLDQVGGDTFVISTTTIIIALLVVILIVVA